MNKSMLTFLTALMLTMLAQIGFAQPGGGQGQGGGMGMNSEAQIKELIAQLGVTSEQEPAFREAMAQISEMRMSAMQQMRGAGGQGGGQGGMMRQNAQNGAQGGDHTGHGNNNADASGDHAGHGAQNGGGNMRAQGQGQGRGQGQGQGQGGGMENMMARRAEMQKQSEEILAKVLTADQVARYSTLQNERMEEMMSRRQNQQ